MSTWVFDLGNTRLKCASLDADGALGPAHALPHAGIDVDASLSDVLPARFERAVIATVAGSEVTAAVLDALTRRTRRITRVRTSAQWGPLRTAYADPERLGVDRFLALVGAMGRGDVLVCGVGTALTLDLLDRDGVHLGGRIAPSPTLMRQALHARAPQLSDTGGDYVEFARDTDDALVSGCEGAAIALVERSLFEARARTGRAVSLLLHGGGGPALGAHLPVAMSAPELVMDGLARWTRADAGLPGPTPLQSDPC